MNAKGLSRRSFQMALIVLSWFAANSDCSISTSEPYDLVFVTNLDPPAIFKAPADTFEFTAIPGLDDHLSTPVAVDYDPVDGMVYWTDVRRETISRAFPDGTGFYVVVSNLKVPDGLSLDTVNRMMYWTDTGSDQIERATMDGLDRSVILDLRSPTEDVDTVQPRAIVVDTSNDRLYWTDWGSAPKIEQANTDGRLRRVLVDTNLQLPNGLALDTNGRRLFWCDAGLDRLESIDLNGGSRTFYNNIISLLFDIHPFDVWFYQGQLYWSDWRFLKLVRMQFNPIVVSLHGSTGFERAGGLHIHDDSFVDHSCFGRTPCKLGERCRQFQDHYECVCQDGFAGLFCKLDNPCASSPCNNGGICRQSSRLEGGFFCKCTDRYMGTYCERFVPACNSSPCMNGGTCFDEVPDSFRCECTAGFVGTTCERKSYPNDLAFVANLMPPGIFMAPTDTFNFTLITGLTDYLSRPVAIDYDPVDGMVYWTDVGHNTISRAFSDGTGFIVLVSGLKVPDGLCLDVVNRVMYWTDEATDLIEKATMDGQDRSIVLNLKNESIDEVKPRAIVIDTTHGHLYWTDWGSAPKIERANIDGSSRTVLVDTGLQLPNGVALDLEGNRMYWCDAGLDLIESTDLLGNDRRVHAELSSEEIHPFDIWFHRGVVYWTDWRFKTILRMDFIPTTPVALFGSTTFLRAGGLHIYADTLSAHECRNPMTCKEGERCRQYKYTHKCVCKDGEAGANCKLENPCASSPCKNEGKCFQSTSTDGDYFCQCTDRYTGKSCETFVSPCESNPCMNDGRCVVELPDSYRCECPSGYVWENCEHESKPHDLVFVANLDPPGIFVAPTDTFNLTEIPVLDQKISRPVAIDYDPVDGMVYWTDVTLSTISRTLLDGTGLLVLISGLKNPDGLSLDIENRVMYWTDSGSDLIERATMDGQDRAVVLNLTNGSISDVMPRAIIVDSKNSYLYWTEVGSSPKIERANTDGTSRQVLVDTDLKWPSGLTLDIEGGRIYWCDAGLNRFESTDLLGDDRRIHADVDPIEIHPFDVWLYGDNLFWTDWRFPQLFRMNFLPDMGVEGMGPLILTKAGGLHIYSDNSTDHSCADSMPCGEGERCRQFQTSYQCVCKDGPDGASCNLNHPCKNKDCSLAGTCYRSASIESGYFCKCVDRYSGTNCEIYEKPEKLNINLSSPLQGNDKGQGNDS
ncbi:low-density lipoprotein receptor-related protein 4-like [Acanthaster planci]|uniref:Low-density lipoprotein receptor-related protein 4-like n=1 Tax=Acanthaster planci TaxID=133434 RepID=A0A8B7Y956_ACAPL|nr:low-density lipoprotein receptor-related protein 4-like [Acanthaster planci]